MSHLQSPSANKHASLYKLGSPPTWKESYKKRCSERLRGSRAKLLDRYRNISVEQSNGSSENNGLDSSIVDDVMREEWNTMQKDDDMSGFDSIISLMEEIKLELMLQEREILLQYDREAEYDASTVKAVVTEHDEGLSQRHLVTCPICRSNYLTKHSSVIQCPCGLEIDTEQDCVSLQHVDIQLRVGAESHAERCSAKPIFGIVHDFGRKNLLMSCNSCDFMFIAI